MGGLPRFIRVFTDPVVGSIPVPIMGGVNKGMLWSLANAGGGFVSGTRSAGQMDVIGALLNPGDVVWDVGAHQGSVALLASRAVGASGQVHAFEPSAMNRWFLERHIRWNSLKNVTIQPYALSNFDGEATFGGSGSSTGFALNQGGEKVQVRMIKTLASSGTPLPTFAKIDVENAEADVLRSAMSALRPDTRLLVSIHSSQSRVACNEILREAGYTVVESTGVKTMPATGWGGDPDVAAFGPDYAGTSKDIEALTRVKF